MPNPVAVNDLSPISGSLQTSRISYAVETAGKDYGQDYNSTTWYSDIPNNGQFYTIISDNYTANYYVSRSNAEGAYVEGGLPAVDEYSAPVFWITAGTSSLDVITIVNGLPDRVGQIPFNSGSQALNWVASSSNYFAVGPDYYDQIDADGLVLYLQGNQVISYPTTGSTWYDLSGYNAKGTLINGTTWNSNGWFTFDGTDDYVNVPDSPNLNLTNQGTISVWINPATVTQDSYSGLASKSTGGSANQQSYQLSWRQISGALFGSICNGSGTYNDLFAPLPTVANVWYNIVFTWNGSQLNMYNNGVVIGTTTQTINNQILATDVTIGGNTYKGAGGGDDTFNGGIANVVLYNKGLTASEVLQNYYGGPIVTSGLFLAQDAGNLVSYPRSGTALYDLTTNNFSGVLTNGVGFSTEVGGALTFDGVDDYVVTNVSTPNITSKTLEVWVRLNDVSQQGGGAINLQYDGGSIFDAIVYNETGQGWGFGSEGFYRTAWSGVVETSTAQWIHMVATYQNNNFRMYRNGILILTTTSFTTLNYNTDSESLLGLRHNGATHLNASIAVGRIYSRALTQAEVLQNYNASF
jgi:hypothetical protein